MNAFQEDFDKLMDLYQQIKQQIRQKDKHLYEQWKAGGFLVDNDIVSMYPDLTKVMETLCDDEEEYEEEDSYNSYLD